MSNKRLIIHKAITNIGCKISYDYCIIMIIANCNDCVFLKVEILC